MPIVQDREVVAVKIKNGRIDSNPMGKLKYLPGK